MGFLKKIFGNKEAVKEATTSPTTGQDAEAAEEERTQTDYEFETLRDDGVRAMRMGEVPFAINCFKSALERKDDDKTRGFLAEAYIHAGMGAEALELLDKLMALEPDNLNLKLAAARSAQLCNDWPRMGEFSDQILEVDEENWQALYFSAQARFQQQDYDGAIERLSKLLEGQSYDPAWLLRAQAYSLKLDFEKAEADVEQLLLNSDFVEEAYSLKGDLCQAQGDVEGAVTAYSKIREANPFSQEATLKLGQLYTANNQNDEALKVYDEALDLQPDFAEALRQRGLLRLQMGDEKGSEDVANAEKLDQEAATENAEGYTDIAKEVNARYKAMNPYGF